MPYSLRHVAGVTLSFVPQRGQPAPAHILISGLSDATWPEDSVLKQFFDLDGCTGL